MTPISSVGVSPSGHETGVAALVGRLVDDSRALVSAEIALYKARAGERVSAFKSAAIFFVAAAVLGLCAFIALLVGLILSLATLIGPLGATGVVVGVVLIAAAVLAMVGKAKLARPGEHA